MQSVFILIQPPTCNAEITSFKNSKHTPPSPTHKFLIWYLFFQFTDFVSLFYLEPSQETASDNKGLWILVASLILVLCLIWLIWKVKCSTGNISGRIWALPHMFHIMYIKDNMEIHAQTATGHVN